MLLLRYGKPLYFAIIATAMRLQQNQNVVSKFNLSKFTLNLLKSFINITEVK
jgi:hypothetical protein